LELRDAWVVSSGEDRQITLAIVDGHARAHAAWSIQRPLEAPLVAGEPLVLEWEEAYSISRGDFGDPTYHDVPAGQYRFRMGGFTLMGDPTGVEASIAVTVPEPLWKTAWFWTLVAMAAMGFGAAGWRVSVWRRITHEMKAMERDRAVERERVRIAQDIHDDLGARVTQISLLSSAAEKRQGLTKEVQQDLRQVSELCRSMVTSLYETVWTVEPENDHLDELGAYICQMTTQICAQSKLRCRLTVPDLPQDIPVGSKVRHELILAVKEAIHNVIKHSGGSELQLHLRLEGRTLSITISDNGSGFDPSTQHAGHGLSNMQRRMASCGGRCSVQSQPGEGTQVRLEMNLPDA
jgi:signal transduction histidine kinase